MIEHKTLIKSFGYAFEGLWHALKYNQNLRIDFAAAILVVILSIYFPISFFEKAILGVMILLVILSEMINTAMEEMVDLITQEHRREAKIAKDVAAGMVLVAALGATILGIVIFAPHIAKLFY